MKFWWGLGIKLVLITTKIFYTSQKKGLNKLKKEKYKNKNILKFSVVSTFTLFVSTNSPSI